MNLYRLLSIVTSLVQVAEKDSTNVRMDIQMAQGFSNLLSTRSLFLFNPLQDPIYFYI